MRAVYRNWMEHFVETRDFATGFVRYFQSAQKELLHALVQRLLRALLKNFGFCVYNGYTLCIQCVAMKTNQVRIRVEADLHQAFMQACSELDRPASQVLREFMKKVVENSDAARQRELGLREPTKV